MIQTRSKYFFALVACVLSVILLLPISVSAANDGINTAADTSLTITFAPDDAPAAGVNFELYRVADLVGEDEFKLTGRFAEYPVAINLDSAETMRVLASTLHAYVVTDNIESDYITEKTNKNGIVSFTGLDTGLYLAIGDVFQYNNQYYFPTPLLVTLPDKNTDGLWQYDIEVTSKHTLHPGNGEKISLDVMKVWNDGDSAERPEEITIDLYEGKLLNDRVTLNKANNWRYSWDELDAGTVWNVVEVDVPDGYTVTIEQIDDTYIVTNTATVEPDEPSSSTPSDSDKPDDSSTPSDSDGSSPTTPGKTDSTSSTTSTNSTKPGETLPQTGMLWWPVLALTAGGLVLIIAGMIRRRGASSGK